MLEQFRYPGLGETRPFCERTAPGCYAPNPAMRFVTTRIAEAGLIMSDDRVVPIADIQCAVGTELYIDGPKAAAGRPDQRRSVFEAKARAVFDDVYDPDGI